MGKYFPLSVMGQKSLSYLIVVICAYLGAGYVVGPIISALVGWLPIVGGLLKLIMWLFRIYCFAGLVVTFLYKFKVIEK